MYSSIRIQGYRGLDSFRMEGLGRVNLLVGKNNCGKTSILECIELLRSAGDPHVLSSIAGRRGEWGYEGERDARAALGPRPEPLDVSHLFANHRLPDAIRLETERFGDLVTPAEVAGATDGVIRIEADRVDGVVADWNDRVTVYVEDRSGSGRDERAASREGDEYENLALRVEWSNAEDDYRAFLTDEGFLLGPRRLARTRNGSSQAVQFVRTSGMTATEVVRTYGKFVLTDKDEPITQALRIVEPAVERLAPLPDDRRILYRDSPGGVVLRLRDVGDRVPIGSMGDGTWRMLGLALAIANAEGGVLLVDEIDTGLHYSVMEDMWRMVTEQAAELSVQVFATTHSHDCVESLAPIAESEAGDVTIQRIERKRDKAVRIGREAVVALPEGRVEVR